MQAALDDIEVDALKHHVAAFAGDGLHDLLNPDYQTIDPLAIARRLSRLCRFAGGTREFYSVAQHSVLVSDYVSPEARPYALLHDAHEAFIGDFTAPVIAAMDFIARQYNWRLGGNAQDRESGKAGFSVMRMTLCRVWDDAILRAVGLEPAVYDAHREAIKAADAYVTRVELEHLVLDRGKVLAFTPLSAERAEQEWMQAFKQYCA